MDLESVRSESCDDAQCKSFLRCGSCVACRQSVSRAVDVYRGVFCKQGQDDFIKIDVRLDFAKTEVGRVDVQRACRVVHAEQRRASVVEFLARKLNHQRAGVVFGVDACSAQQIVHKRRKVELSCKSNLVVEIHLRVESHCGLLHVFFFVRLGCRVEIEELAGISHRHSAIFDRDVGCRGFVIPVRAFAEHEFGRAFVGLEVDAERQVKTDKRVFENFHEIVACLACFVKIFDARVFQACAQTVERHVKVDAVAQGYEHAELKLRKVKTVVESDANTAVKVGVFKVGGDAFDVEHFEHLIEESGHERHFKSVVADLDAVDESCHESEKLRGVHALVFAVFSRESGCAAAVAAARNVHAEHGEQFVDVDFDLFDFEAKHVKVRIEPAVLQIERNDLFFVGFLGNDDFRR